MSENQDKLTRAIISLATVAKQSGLPGTPSGIVLLYPDQAYLQVLLGEFPEGPAREDLRQSLRNAAEEL